MNINELKNKILQLAIQGKLVPQDENDTPASVLLKEIKMEKEKLIKEKKIKKEKLLPEITDEEKPFDLPKGWEWCRLGDISTIKGGKRVPAGYKLLDTPTDYIYIRVADMKNGTIVSDNIKYIEKKVYDEIKNYYIESDDIYITIAGTIGRVGIVPEKFNGMNLTENASKIKCIKVNKDFIFRALNSDLLQKQIIDKTKKVGQPKLALNQIQSLLIPLPPVAEQQRIVQKVNELFAIIDELAKNKESMLENISNTRNKVLELAIQGKLVEQDENDEPASVLLEEVKREKEKLIKEKKIKKEKPLLEITDEEKPFELPKGWEWIRLGDMMYNLSGLSYKKEQLSIKSKTMIRVMRGGNILNMKYQYKQDDIFITDEIVKEDLLLKKFDFITPAVSSLEHIGKIAMIKEDLNDTTVGGFVLILRNYLKEEVLLNYLFYFLNSNHYRNSCRNITNKSGQAFYNISRNKMSNLLIAIPPLKEQKRIIQKIDKIMNYLDTIEESIR